MAHGFAFLALYLTTALFLVLVVTGRQVLPERFLGDGYTIQRIAQGRSSIVHHSSYMRVADVYQALRLQDSPVLAGVLGYGLMVLTVLFAVRDRALGLRGLPTFVVALSCLALGGVFLGWYSKDFLVLGITVVMIRQLRKDDPSSGWMLTLIPILGYAAWFRDYWAGIAAVFVGLYTLVRLRPPATYAALLRRLFLLSQAALAAAALLFPVLFGEPADFARTSANVDRLASPDAASTIGSYVDTVEPLSTYLNLALTQIGLVVPWPLLAAREPQHLVYAVFIAFLWLGSLWTLARRYPSLDGREREVVQLGLSFLLAVLTVQALFEPDYGSYLRHLTPTLPLLLCMLVTAQSRLASSDAPLTSPPAVDAHDVA